jgi:hypothetical protein
MTKSSSIQAQIVLENRILKHIIWLQVWPHTKNPAILVKLTAIQLVKRNSLLCASNSTIQYRVHDISPLIPVLMFQTTPVRTHASNYCRNNFNIILPYASSFILQASLAKTPFETRRALPTRVPCPGNVSTFDLTALLTSGNVYKLWTSSLSTFLHPEFIHSLLHISFRNSYTSSRIHTLRVRTLHWRANFTEGK